MSTTEKGKRSGKSKATTEEKASREALDILLSQKRSQNKTIRERRMILKQLRGCLSGSGLSVDGYLAEKRREVAELEDR